MKKKLIITVVAAAVLCAALIPVGIYVFNQNGGTTTDNNKNNNNVSPKENDPVIVEHEGDLVQFEGMPTEYAPAKNTSREQGGVYDAYLQTRSELPEEVPVQKALYPQNFKNLKNKKTIYVSTRGHDGATGTIDDPFKDIQEAIDCFKDEQGGTLYIRGGEYYIQSALNIPESCSGTSETPFIISSYNNENVQIKVGTKFTRSMFKSAESLINSGRISPTIREKLSQETLNNLLVLDTDAYGYDRTTLGDFKVEYKNGSNKISQPSLVVDGDSQTIARYPNAEDTQVYATNVISVGKISNTGSALYEEHKDDPSGFEMSISDNTIFDWDNYPNLLMYGAVYTQWSTEYFQITANKETKTISTPNPSKYGASTEKNPPEVVRSFYFFNALEAIDKPGEWYMDKQDGLLYYYPTGDFKSADYITKSFDMLKSSNLKNTIINGLSLSGSTSRAIYFNEPEQVLFENMKISNIDGEYGAVLNCGTKSGFIDSEFSKIRYTMLALRTVFTSENQESITKKQNNPRGNLKPTNQFCQNCSFKNPLGQGQDAAINVTGVGTIVSHNYFEETRIVVGNANECVIEYNDIKGGSNYTVDGAPIYFTGGMTMSARGSSVRYNYLHDLLRGHAGIYLDDYCSGIYVYGNIVDIRSDDLSSTFNGKRAIRMHGGRENVICNNIINGVIGEKGYAVAEQATHLAQGSTDWESIANKIKTDAYAKYNYYDYDDNGTLVDTGAPKGPVYYDTFNKRYPFFKELIDVVDHYVDSNYNDDDDLNYISAPSYNDIRNNIVANYNGNPDIFEVSTTGLQTLTPRTNNQCLDTNYVASAGMTPWDEEYQIFDYDVFDHCPDFEDIPFALIGNIED